MRDVVSTNAATVATNTTVVAAVGCRGDCTAWKTQPLYIVV